MNNISQIVKQKLCANCGACAAICPQKAIRIKFDSKNFSYYPEVDKSKCDNCGLCLKVCPGKEMFGKDTDKNILESWLVYSKDINLRSIAQSGGAISQFLIYALESGIINGCLVTKLKETRPLLTETFIARNRKEILEAVGSKYCSAPACTGLDKIKKGDRLIFVGTSCQITGIKKICVYNQLVKDSIFLYFGLICDGTLNFAFPEMIYEMVGLKEEEKNRVLSFDYRFKDNNHNWPGCLKLSLKDRDIFLPNNVRGSLKRFFYNERCKICVDKLNQNADLVFGDFYIRNELQEERSKGISLVFARTQQGLHFFEENHFNANLEIKRINKDLIFSSAKMKNRQISAKKNIAAHERLYSNGLRDRWGVGMSQCSLFIIMDYFFIDLFKKKIFRKIFSKFYVWKIIHKIFSIKDKYINIYEKKN